MKRVGIIGWRGMVGSVLVERMVAEGDFARFDTHFFSTSQTGMRGPDIGRDTPRLIGAEINLSAVRSARLDAVLFGETQGRIVISVSAENVEKVLMQAKVARVSVARLGVVYMAPTSS